MSKSSEGELSLEERMRRLEEILARMESTEIRLGEALELFEEGVSHVKTAGENQNAQSKERNAGFEQARIRKLKEKKTYGQQGESMIELVLNRCFENPHAVIVEAGTQRVGVELGRARARDFRTLFLNAFKIS